jgi:hypothetical protein
MKHFSGCCLTEMPHPVILCLCLLNAFEDLDGEYVVFIGEIGIGNTACDWTEADRSRSPV